MLKDIKLVGKYQRDAYNALMEHPNAIQALKLFSVSQQDADLKAAAYIKAMAFTAELEDAAMRNGDRRRVLKFASAGQAPGMGNANLRGTTLFPATILNYVSGISSIFAVERDIATPGEDLQFVDFYSMLDGSSILPNLGKDASFGKNIYTKDYTSLLDGTEVSFAITIGQNIIPRTIKFKATLSGSTYEIYDDGNGNLLAAPGILADSVINYNTGAITIEFATAPAATNDKLTLVVSLDSPAEDEIDKLAGEVKYFHVDTNPIIIPLIRNILTDAALNKQGVIDPNALYTNLIQTQYTKATNEKCVDALVRGFSGNTYTADLSAFTIASGRYDSLIRTIQSTMVDAESLLGQQTYKGAKITGILAGRKAANLFQYMNSDEGWIPNQQLAYFKDLIGWYKGCPVVRWDDSTVVADDEMFITHKTIDGQLAPVARAMYITPTDLPEVGNFKNMTQVSDGMFSIEGFEPTTTKLTLKLKFTLPNNQFLTVAP